MKVVRFLLFPIAILYYLATSFRNYLYDLQLLKSNSFNLPIIVVGNLSVGGTGKTPQIEYLIRLLKNKYKIAVLSRGYKRKTKRFVLLNKHHSARDVGDEPLQFFKKFTDISVAVDANRVAGVRKLIHLKSPNVILLDDAYQHRKIKASFYILLTKFSDLFTDDFLLPTGNLRESAVGARRATVILVTKCPLDLSKKQQDAICLKLKKYKKPIYFTGIAYANQLKGSSNIAINNLINYEVLLVTGIANPEPMLHFLSEKKIRYQHVEFADHHHFTAKDLNTIQQKFDDLTSNHKIILTSEKDFMRLEAKLSELSYLAIETVFLEQQHLAFDIQILNHLKENDTIN